MCRAPGSHGDFCHLTRPCGDGYWCVDAISAWNHQICLPECINIDQEQLKKGYSTNSTRYFPDFGQKWDNGIVPFVADCSLEKHELALFSEAMKEIEDKTGIKFIRYNKLEHTNYIVLTDHADGVASAWVGKMQVPGWQPVNLDTPWMNTDYNVVSAIHELMHTLGWPHTQSRPDRDAYVTILDENIEDANKHNFNKDYSDVFEKVQKCRPYNYDSIMHYPKQAFSKNGLDTISTKDGNKMNVIGNRDALTSQDIDEIKAYYFGNACNNGQEYMEVSSESCEYNGLNTITDVNECKEAASVVGRTIVWGPYGGYEDVVDGCSARASKSSTQLFFNEIGRCDPSHRVGEWTHTGCKCTDWMPCLCKKSF